MSAEEPRFLNYAVDAAAVIPELPRLPRRTAPVGDPNRTPSRAAQAAPVAPVAAIGTGPATLAREAMPVIERGRVAEMLGPRRTPWLMRHYPRATGVAMVAVSLLLASWLFAVYEDGGLYSTRSVVAAPILLLLGTFLAIVGRPTDAEGYTPHWWNQGYLAALVTGAILGGAVLFGAF